MLHRISPLLLVLLLSLTVCASANAAGPPATGGTAPPVTSTVPATVTLDPVLAKLNTLREQVDSLTAKLDAATAKLDAATTKLDALTVKTKDAVETTHYTKSYLQGSIPEIMHTTWMTCHIASQARDAARGGSQVIDAFVCP